MKRLKNFQPYYHLLHAFFMLCLVVLGSELDEVESEPPLPPPPEAQLLPPEPSLPPPESPLPPPESPMPPPEQSPLPPESPLQPPESPLPPPESPLDANFYSQSCSTLGAIVGLQVMKALMVNARNAAYLVRLQFQDCFVNGCDASILLDGPNSEKVLGSNLNSTRGYELIDTIKQAVEAQCPGVVSCSDIIVLSAYYAATLSALCPWPPAVWAVPLGRKDATDPATKSIVENSIPNPSDSLTDIAAKFQKVNLTITDMVALSGAHTLGAANCKSFIYRTSGTGGDPNMDPKFKAELQRVCGGGLLNGNDTQIISGSFEKGTFPLDPTPSYFDNAYYQSLLNHTGLLASDQLLVSSTEADLVATTKVLVDKYSENKTIFQIDFGASMVKMSTIGVLTGKDGQVRQNCRMPNSQKFERRGF